MRILILGGTGMLGHRLLQLASRGLEVWATVRGAPATVPDWPGVERARLLGQVDALNTDDLLRALAQAKPEVVINCVGLIKQLAIAHSPIPMLQVNSLLPHRLALHCEAVGARLIHISTDCVFSGAKGGYVEADPSDATDLYGRTKYLGEVAYPHALTLRTSIIGRELKTRYGLVEWFLSQTAPVRGFTRALYTGFTTDELARIVLEVVLPRPELSGLYHVSSDCISKYELLGLVKAAFHSSVPIEPEADFVCDRSLDSSRFRKATGYTPPTWLAMIRELAANANAH